MDKKAKSSLFHKGRGKEPSTEEDKTKKPSNTRRRKDDCVTVRSIADDVRKDGFVELFHDIKEPRPFEKFGKLDAFDMHDWKAPFDASIDEPSGDFDWFNRQIRQSPTPAAQMECLVEDGGVRKQKHMEGLDLQSAPEALIMASDGCRVWIHYSTYVEKGKKLVLIDSTKKHRMATSLEIGVDGIAGLYFALKSMKKKEIAEFLIESDYAYGRMGIPGFVQGNQSLRFVVQLMEITTKTRKSAAFMDEMERMAANLTLEDITADVEQLIEAAKAKFNKKLYREATDRYTWALEVIQDFIKGKQDSAETNGCESSNEDSHITPQEKETLDKKCYQIYCNLALCYNSLEDYEEAETICTSALALEYPLLELQPKLLYRYADSLLHMQKYEEASEVCDRGLASEWGHDDFMKMKSRIQDAMMSTTQQEEPDDESRFSQQA